jgi:hypothetical protein
MSAVVAPGAAILGPGSAAPAVGLPLRSSIAGERLDGRRDATGGRPAARRRAKALVPTTSGIARRSRIGRLSEAVVDGSSAADPMGGDELERSVGARGAATADVVAGACLTTTLLVASVGPPAAAVPARVVEDPPTDRRSRLSRTRRPTNPPAIVATTIAARMAATMISRDSSRVAPGPGWLAGSAC